MRALLRAWSDFPPFLSLADHMPDKYITITVIKICVSVCMFVHMYM